MSNLSVAQVVAHVRNPDEAARLQAVRVLFGMATAEAGQGLRLFGRDPSANVRRLAGHAYQQLETRLGGAGSIPEGLPPGLGEGAAPGGGAPAAAPAPAAPRPAAAPAAAPVAAPAAGAGGGGLAGLVGGGGTSAAARGVQPTPAAPAAPAASPGGLAGLAGGGGGGLAGLVGGAATSAAARAVQPAPQPEAAPQAAPPAGGGLAGLVGGGGTSAAARAVQPAPAAAPAAAADPAPGAATAAGPGPEAQQLMQTFAQAKSGYEDMRAKAEAGYAALTGLRQRALAAGVPEAHLVMPAGLGAGGGGAAVAPEDEDPVATAKAEVRAQLRPALSAAAQAAARADKQTPPLAPAMIEALHRVAARILQPCVQRAFELLEADEVSNELAATAARALGYLRPPGAIPVLQRVVEAGRMDPAFFEALGAQRDPAVLPILMNVFSQDRFAHAKPFIAQAVVRVPGAEADQTLVRLLDDPDPSIRTGVITHLGEETRPGFARHLLTKLGQVDDYAGMALVKTLASYGDQDASIPQRLSEELARVGSQDDRMAVAVMGAIGKTRSGELLGALSPFAKSRENRVRKAAIEAICALDIPDDSKTKVLRPILIGDKDSRWKAEVAVELARLGDPKGLSTLEEMVGSQDPNERSLACWGLGEARPPNLVQALHGAVVDANIGVRIAATRALKGETSSEALSALQRNLRERDPDLKLVAVESMGEAGPSAHAAVCEFLSAAYEPPLIAASIRAVAATDPQPPGSLQRFREHFDNEHASVRLACVEATSRVMDEEAREPLLKLLEDPEHKVRLAALRRLWTWGEMRVAFNLFDLLVEDDEERCTQGCLGLREIGTLHRDLDEAPQAGRLVAALQAHPDFQGSA